MFKLIKCNTILTNIENEDEQYQTLDDYHTKNKHRGINETLLHIQREYYFPQMKSKITTYINNCDICKITKYDRKPPNIKFEITETPQKPLEILHLDVFHK